MTTSIPSSTTSSTAETALAEWNKLDKAEQQKMIYQWILDLASPEEREGALQELSRRRESLLELGPVIWHSFGTIAILLQEIVAVYPAINPPGNVSCLFTLWKFSTICFQICSVDNSSIQSCMRCYGSFASCSRSPGEPSFVSFGPHPTVLVPIPSHCQQRPLI